MTDKTVGVIGGLGPEATLDFFAKVLKATPARRDQHHLHLIINNNPKVPDRNRALRGDGESPAAALADMARALQRAGAQVLCMPCNTAHAYAAAIRAATPLPFISIIDATLETVRTLEPAVSHVGLLTADGGRRARVYEDALQAAGLTAVRLDDDTQNALMQLIYGVKAGRTGAAERAAMAAFAKRLINDGAQVIVAGCTEVPLLLGPADVAVPLIDSTDALARAVVRFARSAEPVAAE